MRSLLFAFVAGSSSCLSAESIDLGGRWELFVDQHLIADSRGISLWLNPPIRREIVLSTDQPWEGPTSAYFSVVQDAGMIRLYYRGTMGAKNKGDHSEEQVTCVVESRDGIHFSRPKVGLIEACGSKDNNIVWMGIESHNFSPFLDANPNCKPDERFKALGGVKAPGKNWQEGATPGGLYAFASADGLRWRKMRKEPVITKGAFDSQNLAFWDPLRGEYRCYSRIFSNKVRAIQSCTSKDFLAWSDGVPNRYDEGVPQEHFYTNATLPCPGAEHLFVSFPKRFVPSRKKFPAHPDNGVSDAVFMTSRDGVSFDRTFLEAWVRPGLDEKNWTERSNMPAWGIAQTSPAEWSIFISEHYRHPDNRIRRLSIRPHGFASVHADAKGGEFTTPPLKVGGIRLLLNYSTSAAGSVQVEIQDETGQPVPGFALTDMPELFGDELAASAAWKTHKDLSSLAGKSVRLRFALRDADVFAIRFADD